MDHRKLLVIILSVAVFVALVLGIALLAYYPGEERTERAEADRREFDPIEFVRRGEDPGAELEHEEDDDFIIVYGSRDEQQREQVDADAAQRLLPEDGVEGVERMPDPEPRDPVVHGPEGRTARPSEEPQVAAERAPAEATPSEPAPSDSPPAPAEPAARPSTPTREYWIQVISSSSRDTAESARERLGQESLGSVIFPVNVSGQNYYRVRVGPYDNRGEANKFLGWIRDLEGFEESYISLVTRS